MPSRDGDDVGDGAPADRPTMEPPETSDADAREQAVDHLREAVTNSEIAEKQFHIREALQLLRVDER